VDGRAHGGVAARLTSHDGLEQLPKISPDGRTVAFTAEYDGNTDVYTVPIAGGEPTRLTWHPGVDQVAEWYPTAGRSSFAARARWRRAAAASSGRSRPPAASRRS
jgi:tricorn protease